MSSNDDESHEQLILLVSAIFGFISSIMSILATTTSGWEITSHLNKTGLFHRCYQDDCTSVIEHHEISIIFCIISQCCIVFAVIGSFRNAFVYRRRITSFIVNIFFFFASLFSWITFVMISSYLLMNGGSAIIFNASLAFLLLATFTASYATGASFAEDKNPNHLKTPIKYNHTTIPMEFYQHVSR